MKIFTSNQIKELDQYTIDNEPIKSIDLMERAAKATASAIAETFGNNTRIVVFAGPGNNGGDALAVARLLASKQYPVTAFLFNVKGTLSENCEKNARRAVDCGYLQQYTEVRQEFDPPLLDDKTVIVDGLFGTGLDRPLSGGFASLVKYINQMPAKVVSIDIPSGLTADGIGLSDHNHIVKADITLTFQQPKLSFFMADVQNYLGQVRVLDIGLSKTYIANATPLYTTLEDNTVRSLMRPRPDFANKGTMGHALLIAGSYGMAGAAILASRACLRSGVGKLTTHVPQCNCVVTQMAVPEAVVQIDNDSQHFSDLMISDTYDSIGIGPGIGQSEETAIAMMAHLRKSSVPMVLDADALNIIASHQAWQADLPKGLILTPHPGEMDRLLGGRCHSDAERLRKTRDIAQQWQAYIILKGHYSALCTPEGHVVFNTTGNSGMATAGSGDVLTGILTALLARGYSAKEACLLGMYLHGLAGDMAAIKMGKESLIASDIIDSLPQAFMQTY